VLAIRTERVGNHLSIGEADDAVGVFQQALVVGGEDEGKAEPAIEVMHQVDQLCGIARIQVGRGLIGQHQGGPMDNCARHRDPLTFAAREQVRAMIGARGKTNTLKRSATRSRRSFAAYPCTSNGNSTFSAAVKTGIRLKV
jgi:hypothetical protein